MKPVLIELPWDDLVPRDEENRYRIYAARNGALHLIATASDPQGVGLAIATLNEEGEFEGHDCAVGVLDTLCDPSRRGTWLVNPFTAGGTRDA